MITVLGQPADVAPYRALPGYNVHPDDWTPGQVREWLAEAVLSGDDIRCVSTDFTGAYDQEIRLLQAEAQKLRMAAAVLNARARALNKAINDISKREIAHEGALLPPVVERE